MSEPTIPATVTAPDEQDLLRRLRDGEDPAYEEMVRAYGPRLLAVARRMMGSEDDAQDALQDAFLSAFKNLHKFKEGAKLSTWLHRIVVNACLMKMRTRRRRPETSIEPMLPAFAENGQRTAPQPPWNLQRDGGIESDETRTLVRDSIDQLPDSYRVVLLLRDIEGLDTEETAAALDITTSAVKTRLHRARQALHTILDPHFREASS